MVWKVLEGGGISLHKEQPACTDYLSAIHYYSGTPKIVSTEDGQESNAAKKRRSMDGHARSTHGLYS